MASSRRSRLDDGARRLHQTARRAVPGPSLSGADPQMARQDLARRGRRPGQELDQRAQDPHERAVQQHRAAVRDHPRAGRGGIRTARRPDGHPPMAGARQPAQGSAKPTSRMTRRTKMVFAGARADRALENAIKDRRESVEKKWELAEQALRAGRSTRKQRIKNQLVEQYQPVHRPRRRLPVDTDRSRRRPKSRGIQPGDPKPDSDATQDAQTAAPEPQSDRSSEPTANPAGSVASRRFAEAPSPRKPPPES